MKSFSDTPIDRMAAMVAEHLHRHGIEVVLVGGLAVGIYTRNLYLTADIDMVNTNYTEPQALNKAMAELGFYKSGRVYANETTDITVEFPSGPLSVGNELIRQTTVVQVGDERIPEMCVEDVVKDRLAAFIHWNDNQSLVQAAALILNHQLSASDFREFCKREGATEQYGLLENLCDDATQKQLTTMEQLESELTRILLANI